MPVASSKIYYYNKYFKLHLNFKGKIEIYSNLGLNKNQSLL